VLLALASGGDLPDCVDLPWASPNGSEASFDFDRPDLPPSGSNSHPNKFTDGDPAAEEVDPLFNDEVPSTATPDNKTVTVEIENHLGTGLTDTNGNSLDNNSCIELRVCWEYLSWVKVPGMYLGIGEDGKPQWLWDGTWEWEEFTSETCVYQDVCDTVGGCAGR